MLVDAEQPSAPTTQQQPPRGFARQACWQSAAAMLSTQAQQQWRHCAAVSRHLQSNCTALCLRVTAVWQAMDLGGCTLDAACHVHYAHVLGKQAKMVYAHIQDTACYLIHAKQPKRSAACNAESAGGAILLLTFCSCMQCSPAQHCTCSLALYWTHLATMRCTCQACMLYHIRVQITTDLV